MEKDPEDTIACYIFCIIYYLTVLKRRSSLKGSLTDLRDSRKLDRTNGKLSEICKRRGKLILDNWSPKTGSLNGDYLWTIFKYQKKIQKYYYLLNIMYYLCT